MTAVTAEHQLKLADHIHSLKDLEWQHACSALAV